MLKIGQLEPHASEAAEIERLLIAARRNLSDARVAPISPETRLDAAYQADYTGDDADETTAQQCIVEAERLIEEVETWRSSNRP